MERVVVQVDHGIVGVVRASKGVRVDVIDLDVLREGDIGDIQAYWRDTLSDRARAYVKRQYPSLYKSLEGELRAGGSR